MKLFVLNFIESIMTEEYINSLKSLTKDVVVDVKAKPILEVQDILDDSEKILAVDPDFVNWELSRESLEKIPNVKVVVISTTSYTWVDVDYLKSKNIKLINTRDFSTQSVAEWLVMMALLVLRKVPLIIKEGYKLDFERYQGMDLSGKKVGIIGLGNLGKKVAKTFQSMGNEVFYWSKNSRDTDFKYVELDELMKTCEIIIPLMAINDETTGMIGKEYIDLCSPKTIFLGMGHAQEALDQEYVLQKVKAGELYGYGMEADKKFTNDYEGNVWSTPKLAWCTEETIQRNSVKWFENIKLAVNGEFPNLVN